DLLYPAREKNKVGLHCHNLLRKLRKNLLLSFCGVPFNLEASPLLIAEPPKLLKQGPPIAHATMLAHPRRGVTRMDQGNPVHLPRLLRPGERHYGNRQKAREEIPSLHLVPLR